LFEFNFKNAKVVKTIQKFFKIRFVRVKSLCIFARSFEDMIKAKFRKYNSDFKKIRQCQKERFNHQKEREETNTVLEKEWLL